MDLSVLEPGHRPAGNVRRIRREERPHHLHRNRSLGLHPVPAMRFVMAFLVAMATLWPASSWAWTVNIASGPTRIYLQAGVGAFNGLFVSGGTPGVSSVENIVSASPSPAAFG